ncbi:MAG TPA: Tab2 family RNA-binding protein [Stenomitos sp.]
MTSPMPSPPQPLPESLWGDRWQFASLLAEDLEYRLHDFPIPIRHTAPMALPSEQDLAPGSVIPGVIIEAGRQAMRLSRWLDEQQPTLINAVNRELGALMIETAQQQQWILATYQDNEVKTAAQTFEDRKVQSCGIHFLLIQPDASGVTYSGLWILRHP